MKPVRRRLRPPEPRDRSRPGTGEWAAHLLLGGALLLAGCTGHVPLPSLSPQEAGRQALAEYDANHDGFLDAAELEKCPALKRSLKAIDQNGDGRLSAQEIADRVAGYLDSGVGLTSSVCTVYLDNRPLEGATVVLEPEKFLGSGVKPASGVTDRDGSAALKAEGQDLPGVQFGFYRVRISKKDGQGRETLPARYNTQTTLGCEIAPDDPRNKRRGPGGRPREENDALIFRLTSG